MNRIDIDVACESLHQDLVPRQLGVTAEAVRSVLDRLNEDYPSALGEDVFALIRNRILAFMVQAADHLECFDLLVVGLMLRGGLIEDPKLPDDLNVPPKALERLASLFDRSSQDSRSNEIVAYIILNCSSLKEVTTVIRSAKFSSDATQTLLPDFWVLCERDPRAKQRLLVAFSHLSLQDYVSDVPVFLEDYCFKMGTQSYALVGFNYPKVPVEICGQMHQILVANALEILRDYLLGD